MLYYGAVLFASGCVIGMKIHVSKHLHYVLSRIGWVPVVIFLFSPLHGIAQEIHNSHPPLDSSAPFIASTSKPFAKLMDEAMMIMADGMRKAPMDGNINHDFVTMMIPHHQGAIDMAKALLLYTKDPQLRNLAKGIITEQQNEIQLLKIWLQQYQNSHAEPSTSHSTPPSFASPIGESRP